MMKPNESRDDDLQPIVAVIDRVRRRTRLRSLVSSAAIGLACGSFVTLALALISIAVTPIGWSWLMAGPMVGCIVGGLVGGLVPVSRASAARTIDTFYRLKDRTLTALQFESEPNIQSDHVRRLVTDDARRHARQVDPKDCVIIDWPRTSTGMTASLLSVSAVVLFMSFGNSAAVIDAMPIGLATEQASVLNETMIKEIKTLAEQVDAPELSELGDQLQDLVGEMSDSMDPRDMLASLSQMEQAITEAREAMNMEATDAAMAALASALEPADAMQAAASAMKNQDYNAAADKLTAIDPAALTDKQRRAVSDNLKKLQANLPPGTPGALSKTVSELQESVESKNSSECKACLSKLASLCKKQGNCKKIGQCMACQLARLSQCKSQCKSQTNSNKQSNNKTQSPSQSSGKGSTNDPNSGPSTAAGDRREQWDLAGESGDGPVETEVIKSDSNEQTAARQYQAKYQKFRRQAEAVLDTEPLPLGHRETVRTYFESIRPTE